MSKQTSIHVHGTIQTYIPNEQRHDDPRERICVGRGRREEGEGGVRAGITSEGVVKRGEEACTTKEEHDLGGARKRRLF